MTDELVLSAESPLVSQLVERHGARWLDERDHTAFAARPGHHVLFFSGDPVRFPEALDVAVVLPELRKASDTPFDIGVVRRDAEDAVAVRWGVTHWPSLVFVREGGWLGCVHGMHDWIDYVTEVRSALAATPGRVPGVGIRVVGPGASSACSA